MSCPFPPSISNAPNVSVFGPVTAGTPPHCVAASGKMMGQALLISLEGGTHPHLGASALAWPDPSAPEQFSVSAVCIPGHRDDIPAKKMAGELCLRFGCPVCICAGLHVDNAAHTDITLLLKNAAEAINKLSHLAAEGMCA